MPSSPAAFMKPPEIVKRCEEWYQYVSRDLARWASFVHPEVGPHGHEGTGASSRRGVSAQTCR